MCLSSKAAQNEINYLFTFNFLENTKNAVTLSLKT